MVGWWHNWLRIRTRPSAQTLDSVLEHGNCRRSFLKIISNVIQMSCDVMSHTIFQDPSDSDMAPSAMRSCQTSEPGLDCMDLNSHYFFERICGGNELSPVTIFFIFWTSEIISWIAHQEAIQWQNGAATLLLWRKLVEIFSLCFISQAADGWFCLGRCIFETHDSFLDILLLCVFHSRFGCLDRSLNVLEKKSPWDDPISRLMRCESKSKKLHQQMSLERACVFD